MFANTAIQCALSLSTAISELSTSAAVSSNDAPEAEGLTPTSPSTRPESELSLVEDLSLNGFELPPAKRRRVCFTSISYERAFIPVTLPSPWVVDSSSNMEPNAENDEDNATNDNIFITKTTDGPAVDVKLAHDVVMFLIKNRKMNRSQVDDFITKAKIAEYKARKLSAQAERESMRSVHPDFDACFQLPAPPSSPVGDTGDKELATFLASTDVVVITPHPEPEVSAEEVNELRVKLNGQIKKLLIRLLANGKVSLLPSTTKLSVSMIAALQFLDKVTSTATAPDPAATAADAAQPVVDAPPPPPPPPPDA